jgi:hypothetical protein
MTNPDLIAKTILLLKKNSTMPKADTTGFISKECIKCCFDFENEVCDTTIVQLGLYCTILLIVSFIMVTKLLVQE